ncbi:DNA-binding protein [Niallia sp. 03190]|uniref:DNA-binding protein n=1 Tax=Niallia sp. 03190 TaxID=3458061 RepID=UPI0040439EBB
MTKYIQNEVINTSEALEILQCSRQNLNDLIKRGVITPIKDLPRDRLFYKEDILQRKSYMDRKK